MLIVESCAATYGGPADVYWHLEPDADPSSIQRLEYGRVPDGYKALKEARPLGQPGCYTVAYGGEEELYFRVFEDGRTSEIGQDEARRLVSGG